MKVNNGLIIISMVIISLLAIGVVSASENVSDVIETTDFEEVVTVNDNLEDSIAIDNAPEDVVMVENNTGNSESLSVESEKVPVAADTGENDIIKENSSSNHIDWTSLYGKNGTGNNSLILDLSDLFGENGKTGNSILVLDLSNILNDTDDKEEGSFLILGLSSLLGNNTGDNSYLALGLSSILDDNNTNYNSFLVLDLPGLGIDGVGNSSLVLDLTNLLSDNGTSKGSFLNLDSSALGIENGDPIKISLAGLYENNKLFGVNLTDVSNGNLTGLANLLDNVGALLGQNVTNITSLLRDSNFTDLINNLSSLNLTELLDNWTSDVGSLFNVSSLLDAWNLTDLFSNLTDLFDNLTSLVDGLNLSDVDSLLDDLNLTELLDNLTSDIDSLLNLTSLLDNLPSDMDSLNLTSLLDDLNLTSLLDKFNWTSITGGNETPSSNNTGFNWDSIFGGKDSDNGSFIDNILDWINGINKNNDGNESVVKKDTVIKVEPAFTRVANDYYANERGAFFYGILKDTDGNILANRNVSIAVNGPIYNVTTDDQGRAGLQVNFMIANVYTYALSFKGDDEYNAAAMASSKLTVTKKSISISASAKSFKAKAKKTIKVTLKAAKNPYDGKVYLKAGKKVTLKIKGKTYTAKANKNGVAKFTIKLTKKGKYTAKIKFAGDKTYKSASKSIKITIK